MAVVARDGTYLWASQKDSVAGATLSHPILVGTARGGRPIVWDMDLEVFARFESYSRPAITRTVQDRDPPPRILAATTGNLVYYVLPRMLPAGAAAGAPATRALDVFASDLELRRSRRVGLVPSSLLVAPSGEALLVIDEDSTGVVAVTHNGTRPIRLSVGREAPKYDRIRVAEGGDIWLRRHAPTRRSTEQWDVYSSAGVYARSMELPVDAELLAITRRGIVVGRGNQASGFRVLLCGP